MTRSTNCFRGLSLVIALSLTISGAGCADPAAALRAAGKTKGEASVIDDALALSKRKPDLPEYPDYCREKERSGVQPGERLDVASLKLRGALRRANARPDRCAAWYGKVRRAYGGGK